MKARPKKYRIMKMKGALEALGIRPADAEGLHLLARLHLAETARHLERIRNRHKPRVGFSPTEVIAMSNNQTDTPSELGAYSDGVTDDASYQPELIGCGLSGISGGLQHLSIAGGLGQLAVGGVPSYLFSRKNLSNPVLRRRLSAAIKALTPKTRRRVLARLRTAVSVARVSGQVRGAYPSVSGGSHVGWNGIMVSGRGGCPYANVVGALTP